MHDDPDIREHVEIKGQRMFSGAMYRRLRSMTADWEREERAKARVALQSLLLLLCVLPLAAGLGWLLGSNLLASLFWGFVFWVALVFGLMHDHFSAIGK